MHRKYVISPLIYIVGAIISARIITNCNRRQFYKYLLLGLIGYLIIVISSFYFGWILPILSPILAWTITTICMAFYRDYHIQENLLQETKIAKEEAIVLKAKRLIIQIWHNVHDNPLQELKTAMYDVDFLAIPESEKDVIVDRLSRVGKEIRQQMTMDVDEKLSLNPQLQDGLVVAIEKYLQKLTDKGKLNLQVVTNLASIPEPINSQWITIREDIFLCFCEVISNALNHGKQTTQIQINLFLEDDRCILIIENDGEVVDADKLKQKIGFGTKLINQIIEYLPDGEWERVALADGGLQVKICWTHLF